MKGDETENKKIGCTVNLLVRVTSSWCFRHSTRFSQSQSDRIYVCVCVCVCVCVLYLLRISTSQRSIRRRCTSATSTNCVTCICRLRTTQVQHSHSHTHTHTHTPCPSGVWLLCGVHRGGLHSAAVLGAAALGRASSEGVPSLPGSDRVAPQRRTLPQSHPLLQQGEGETTQLHTHTHTQLHTHTPADRGRYSLWCGVGVDGQEETPRSNHPPSLWKFDHWCVIK